MFKIEFETLNAGVQSPEQVSRIIKHVSRKVKNYETEGRIRDDNGNTIGGWSWSRKIENLTESEKFRSSLLAMHLSNDYDFYSSLKSWFGECAIAMREGTYKESDAKSYLLEEITKICMSPAVKKHVGPTSNMEKEYCSEILLEKYEEEMRYIMEEETHA